MGKPNQIGMHLLGGAPVLALLAPPVHQPA